MMIRENISLKPYNSFGIDVSAKYFAAVSSLPELEQICMTFRSEKMLVLGGGSNILFTGNYKGIVCKNEITGIEWLKEDENYHYIKAAAGENWHQFVTWCIAHNYAGVENLSLIPGSVGASPIQNIGAYGVEIKDVFHELEAYDLMEKRTQVFGLQDCAFGYRESIFKKKYAGRFLILNVTYRLPKQPSLSTHYGAIEAELERMQIKELSIKAISDAVIHIRRSKLPDPSITGNAGSFFKNPVIPAEKAQSLQKEFPKMPAYPADNQMYKLAAGWLIEQCGWKGFRKADAGCYDKQALVLVNYGNATGNDIFELSEMIIRSVQNRFGILLEREVNIL